MCALALALQQLLQLALGARERWQVEVGGRLLNVVEDDIQRVGQRETLFDERAKKRTKMIFIKYVIITGNRVSRTVGYYRLSE